MIYSKIKQCAEEIAKELKNEKYNGNDKFFWGMAFDKLTLETVDTQLGELQ